MKRLILFVVALVFAFSTSVMAVEKAAAPVKEEPKVEEVGKKKVPAETKAMNRGVQVEKARKENAENAYNKKSGKGSQNTQQEETTSNTQSTTSSTKSTSKSDLAYEKCIKNGGTKKQCGK
jgi:hypothetical protein